MDINAPYCDAYCDWTVLKMCEAFGYGADMAREVLCGDFDDYTYASINLYKKQGRWVLVLRLEAIRFSSVVAVILVGLRC